MQEITPLPMYQTIKFQGQSGAIYGFRFMIRPDNQLNPIQDAAFSINPCVFILARLKDIIDVEKVLTECYQYDPNKYDLIAIGNTDNLKEVFKNIPLAERINRERADYLFLFEPPDAQVRKNAFEDVIKAYSFICGII